MDALSGLVAASFNVTGTSNEPSDPKDPDIVITPNGSGGLIVQLRAQRDGNGGGRTYTLTATASDKAGNAAMVTATCLHINGNLLISLGCAMFRYKSCTDRGSSRSPE